jgi:hypothetical protein
VFTHPLLGDDAQYLDQVFHDFTEYLLIHFLSSRFTKDDIEKEDYWGEALRSFAIPNPSIRAEPQPRNQIDRQFQQNLFYDFDVNSIVADRRLEFCLPKDTHASLRRKGADSCVTIKNSFLRIDIGIRYLAVSSQDYTFLRDMDVKGLGKPYRAFRQFKACVYYEVRYSKRRYGYPVMRDYEKWSSDLLSLLREQFSWGDPPRVDDPKAMEYFDMKENPRQNKQETGSDIRR